MVVIISSCRTCLVIRYAVTSALQSSRVLSVELGLQWVTGPFCSGTKFAMSSSLTNDMVKQAA
jgi:hypothetical protein